MALYYDGVGSTNRKLRIIPGAIQINTGAIVGQEGFGFTAARTGAGDFLITLTRPTAAVIGAVVSLRVANAVGVQAHIQEVGAMGVAAGVGTVQLLNWDPLAGPAALADPPNDDAMLFTILVSDDADY
jgi:hypothetical protein